MHLETVNLITCPLYPLSPSSISVPSTAYPYFLSSIIAHPLPPGPHHPHPLCSLLRLSRPKQSAICPPHHHLIFCASYFVFVFLFGLFICVDLYTCHSHKHANRAGAQLTSLCRAPRHLFQQWPFKHAAVRCCLIPTRTWWAIPCLPQRRFVKAW